MAADWAVLPPGTRIWIDGLGAFIVEDQGEAIVGDTLDLYLDQDDDALYEWGVRYRPIYVIEWGR